MGDDSVLNDVGPQKWTEPHCVFALTALELFEFGALTRQLPKTFERLEELDPESDELLVLRETHYHDWILVQDRSRFFRICDEALLGRAVDAFDHYLVSIMEMVFRREPRLLKSKSTLTAEELLSYTSIDEVVERLIRRKVEELSYAGFAAILAYVRERMGARPLIEEEPLRLASEAIAMRNIIVHNRGLVNQRFQEQTGRTDPRLGTPYPFGTHEVLDWVGALEYVTLQIDQALIVHFSLPHIELNYVTNRELKQLLRTRRPAG